MRKPNLVSMAFCILAATAGSVALADEPIAWGAPAGAKGCVTFREYEKIVVSASDTEMQTTAKSHFELEVVSSQGYDLPKKVWSDDQGTMDQLQNIAVQDRIRFVKIKDHYSPTDLEAAQSLCRQAMAPLP
jgi:hypothetical protein